MSCFHPGLVVAPDDYVDGPQSAFEAVRYSDGLAVYDLDDLRVLGEDRLSPEKVREALRFGAEAGRQVE